MVKQGLLAEFDNEAEGTRKLLAAIPPSSLDWKPAEKCWNTAELAAHIAEIYSWYGGVFNHDVFDLGQFDYDQPDISDIENIRKKFEENVAEARKVLENVDEQSLFNDWTLNFHGEKILPTMKRIAAARGFLMSHLYHHRGEMIVYLRATGNKVPGLYGPTADDNF